MPSNFVASTSRFRMDSVEGEGQAPEGEADLCSRGGIEAFQGILDGWCECCGMRAEVLDKLNGLLTDFRIRTSQKLGCDLDSWLAVFDET